MKDTLPEILGDPKDKSFRNKLGKALGKRRDQKFETTVGLLLLSSTRDNHNKVEKWILLREEYKAGNAGIAGIVQPNTENIFYTPHTPPCVLFGGEGEIPPALPASPAEENPKYLYSSDMSLPDSPFEINTL